MMRAACALAAASFAAAGALVGGERAVPDAAAPAAAAPANRSGGPTTVPADGRDAFGMVMPGLSREERRAFVVGNSFFRDNWVVAPAAPGGREGLGPLYAANSCSACHPDDGRGAPTTRRGQSGVGMVVLVSPCPTGDASSSDASGAHAIYGRQLQDAAIPGVAPEATMWLEDVRSPGTYSDGTTYELRRWNPRVESLGYGPLGDVRLSVRIGQQVIGLGLLESVPASTLEALADPSDRNGDGISGRVHRVPDGRVGRFGWKASQASIADQVQVALQGDIGITSPRFPEDEQTAGQRRDIHAATAAASPEADAMIVDRLAHYCRVLAVPAQRNPDDARVVRGRTVFAELGCTACHVPTMTTDDSSPVAQLRKVEFHAYTDLLLHDMGDGLADRRRDGDADGREWRTPPLWGIGLVQTVNEQAGFLHDGRARTLEEAVLWHGGEAQAARERFLRRQRADRDAVIAFMNSL
jgi:CxxC motif-containing protein (DUF1111 family)